MSRKRTQLSTLLVMMTLGCRTLYLLLVRGKDLLRSCEFWIIAITSAHEDSVSVSQTC